MKGIFAFACVLLLCGPMAYAGGHSSGSHSSGSHSSSTGGYHASRSTRAVGVARDGHGRIKRSAKARDDFKRAHPCPSTGGTSGSCPGYVIDHVQALKHGGADTPSNMQWQTVEAAKAKDKIE